MLQHFPFTNTFDLRMGTSPLPDVRHIIECDEHYLTEVELKRRLLKQDPVYCYRSDSATLKAQWEALELILASAAASYPDRFLLNRKGIEIHWMNRVLQESYDFELGNASSLPLEPLNWVGRQVQEDLIILDSSLLVKAGQLCFPSGWDLGEKFGKHFLDVHEPLPEVMRAMIETANMFMQRLPTGKSFQRNNWGIRVTDELDLSTRHVETYKQLLASVTSSLNAENAGSKLFVRVEHQTLTRLPSENILFTIHTYNSLLEEEAKDETRRKTLFDFLSGVPKELQDYKQITPLMPAMLGYLKQLII